MTFGLPPGRPPPPPGPPATTPGTFKRQVGDVAKGVWGLFVKGEVPEGVKRALKPCERCQGRRAIAWNGILLPCPVCCHEDGSIR